LLLEKALRLLEQLPCIGDAHVHLVAGETLEVLARELAAEYRVGLAQVMEIRPPVSRVAGLPRELLARAWEAAEPVLGRLAPWLLEHYGGPGRLHAETLLFLNRFPPVPRGGHDGPGARLIVYADPEPGRSGAAERAEEAVREGARGFKLITTIHLIWPDSPAVGEVFEAAESLGVPVLAHAGCDPGLWELPAFCALGNPRRLEEWIRSHPDVDVVIAHLGGYSAAAPGVFTEEAIALARRHPNVYLDTSAVPLEVLEIAVKSLGPDKLIHGSDYPVVEGDDPGKSAARLAAALLAAGRATRSALEKVFYRNLEEITGEKCRPIPLA
jgi:hypothetical protein